MDGGAERQGQDAKNAAQYCLGLSFFVKSEG
jgi:hypothetical protein